ncbi:Predicted DNA-binding transcriptional regulator YafY, contains an HTH and WYL domains [Paenibacillus sp. ov031]|uniref:helix-turn-helix transcriptional regulator n=1 Tax=Paenibacillus TaxID=44249 RepID=UPI000918D96C|nr:MULTISPECIES: YafY family protein [Paenibacillus]MCZ1264787.1 YafY family transcriptional regulator [Paenibacillus tundrae]SHN69799.1 Predicted DNA-binding transcriptional regulator YafY, contains an HTH and WYL domains [Paenibacillus sp. ov031]
MNNRKLALMRLMDSRKKFTARELAERFQVSIRTIQRDLNDLQELGFPLYTEVGVNGGYRVLPNRILPPLQLTQHEALGLFMMIEYLENVPDFPYGSIREHLAVEYYSTLPQDVQDLITRMRQHVTFLQHHAVQVEAVTTEILGAAVDQREIEFIYHSRQGHKKVQVFPIGIYYDHGYWYMPARRKDRVLLYRVDRMQELVMLDSIDESVPSLKEWLNYKENRKSVEVVLQFTDFGARLAGSDVLFKSVGGNEWRGLVPPEEFPFTARKLLSYGPEVKVIEPLELQQQVREMLERSLNQY